MRDNDQREAPLLAAMLGYVRDGVAPFHTPGHKMGKGMDAAFAEILGSGTLALDLALCPDLDDLQEPHGPIGEAQKLAAQLYGADHSFFLINGTTAGIYAMILTVAGPGEKIIVPRNAHRSIIGGIILSGAMPIYIQPEFDDEFGMAMGVTPESVEAAIRLNPDAKAVLLINPTYYGVASDIARIAKVVHECNMPLLVDEAHGPHFKFSNRLPLSALDAGADAVAQSSHKIIGALSQSSILHCRDGRLDIPRLKTMLGLVQSTSPNYILLASLDVARRQMACDGPRLIDGAVELAENTRRRINSIPGLKCFGDEKIGLPGAFALDPTKLTVSLRGIGLPGAAAERILRYDYKVQPELADLSNLLFLITFGDNSSDADRLVSALTLMAAEHAHIDGESAGNNLLNADSYFAIPHVEMSPREAVFRSSVAVPFEQSIGRVCAEIVTFYPPGVPLICPGERITRNVLEQCRQMQEAGLHVSGPEDYMLKTIKVVE